MVKAWYDPSPTYVIDGHFQDELRTCLKIHPSCSMNADIVVLTFIIVEKKRREKAGEEMNVTTRQDDGDQEEPGFDSGTI